jgi:hypothetical protein
MTANYFAYFMVYAWPLVVFYLLHRYPLDKAVILSVVCGYLLLPTSPDINFPLLPTINKQLVPSLAVLLFSASIVSQQRKAHFRAVNRKHLVQVPLPQVQQGWLPRSRVGIALIGLMGMSTVYTVITNLEPIFITEEMSLPANTYYDVFATLMNIGVLLLPFLLGRRFLATSESHNVLLKIIAIAGLCYTIPAVIEIRLSPQLNVWIYGYFPHSFAQHVRAGGYRPLVFLEHGLQLGIFFTMATLACLSIWKRLSGQANIKYDPSLKWFFLVCWIVIVSLLSKTLGAFALMLILAPVVLWMAPKRQMMIAGVLAAIVLVYPMLRSADLVPVERIEQAVQSISTERAKSLTFRFTNEDLLLARAAEKPIAGWGSWGRSRIFNEFGKDISATDGMWVIIFGQGGWARYIATFGLLTLPLILMSAQYSKLNVKPETAILALMLAANLVDLLPNSSLTPVTWLIAGALLGRMELRTEAVVERKKSRSKTRHSRSHGLGATPVARDPSPRRSAPLSRYAVTHTRGGTPSAPTGSSPKTSRKAPS